MFDKLKDFRHFPGSVKNAIIFLVGGWAWHFIFLVKLKSAFGGEIPASLIYQQGAIAAVVIVFVLAINNWARILCMVSNLLIILLHLFFLALFHQRIDFFLLSILNVLFFSAATSFFWRKETAAFYKS